MLRAGDVSIGLSQDDWQKGRQNIDEIAARLKAAGVKLDAEPHDTEWKTRAFEVTAPSGFKITIGSEI